MHGHRAAIYQGDIASHEQKRARRPLLAEVKPVDVEI